MYHKIHPVLSGLLLHQRQMWVYTRVCSQYIPLKCRDRVEEPGVFQGGAAMIKTLCPGWQVTDSPVELGQNGSNPNCSQMPEWGCVVYRESAASPLFIALHEGG